jgi:hypothetical protein
MATIHPIRPGEASEVAVNPVPPDISEIGGGDGGGGPVDPASREYVDSKLEVLRAESIARHVDIMAELRIISARMLTLGGGIALALATGLGVVAIILAALAFGNDLFGSGLGASGMVDAAIERQADDNRSRDERVERIERLLQERLPAPQAPAPPAPN